MVQGLDVRLNLATGKRFAKLIDGADGERVSIQAQARNAMAEAVSTLGDTADTADTIASSVADSSDMPTAPTGGGGGALERMKEILLGLPEPEEGLAGAIASGKTGAELDAIVQRVWKERQSMLRDVMARAQTEGQQMQGALGRIVAQAGHPSQVRESLLDLEFHVSSAHNAEDFRNGGGFAVLAPLLNHSDSGVRAAAAWALGSAVKYSPKNQRVAALSGAAEALAGILADTAAGAGAIVETCAGAAEGPGACARAVLEPAARASYALGALVRSAPADVLHAAVSANTHGAAAAAARGLAQAALGQSDPEVAGPLRSVAVKCLGVAADTHSAAAAAARGVTLPEAAGQELPSGGGGASLEAGTNSTGGTGGGSQAEVLATGAQLHGAATATPAAVADGEVAAAAEAMALGARDTIAASFRGGDSCAAALYVLAGVAAEPHEGSRQELMRRAVRAVSELPVSCRAGMAKASALPRTESTRSLLVTVSEALEEHRRALHETAKAALAEGGATVEEVAEEAPLGGWNADGSEEGTEAHEAKAAEALRQYEHAATATDAADAMGVVDGVLKQVRAGLMRVMGDTRQ